MISKVSNVPSSLGGTGFHHSRSRTPITTCAQVRHQQHPPKNEPCRRTTLATILASLLAFHPPPPSLADETLESTISVEDTLSKVTDKVYINFGLCESAVVADRKLGDKSILCQDPEPLGRVVIGLYGDAAPGTVANFKRLIASGALIDTSLSKILPGQYFIAGQQGPTRAGLLNPPADLLQPNPDILDPKAFKLRHLRPGTVSLNLSANEDEDYIRYRQGYRNVSFFITTGPGPAPSLDGENIVFGRILEGTDVINSITRVPTFQPLNSNIRAFNELGRLIGDERAAKTSSKWGKPLKAVLITSTGMVS